MTYESYSGEGLLKDNGAGSSSFWGIDALCSRELRLLEF